MTDDLEPFDIPGARSRLAGLRREAAALLALIDTAELPRPRQIRPAGEQLPGPEWRVGKDWAAHVVDGDYDMVFVRTPDAWGGDVVAVELAEARRVAMMLLAAAAWADQNRPPPPDVPVLDDRRRARPPGPARAAAAWRWRAGGDRMKLSDRRIRYGRIQLYLEPRDIWVGVFVDPDVLYVCLLPCVVMRWTRTTRTRRGEP